MIATFGMRICRSDAGTSKTFTCTYHGWAYDLEGNLINVPLEERAYHNEIDKSRWGALKVPRIANYRGFLLRYVVGGDAGVRRVPR